MGLLTEMFAPGAPPGVDFMIEQDSGGRPLSPPGVQGVGGQPLPAPYGRVMPTWYKVQHAPAGGVTVAGKHFTGGQFIPDDVMARASPAERAAVETGESRPKPIPPGPAGAQTTGGVSLPPPSPVPPGDPFVTSPGLTPEEAALEQQSQAFVRRHYPALRDQYFARNAVTDPATGSVRSVTLNTDEWRDLMPGYVGTNASAVHEAASWANNQLYREALTAMRGQGNNKLLVLAGGGGSGKGTAAPDVLPMAEYPIVLDQVSDRLQKLESKLDEAAANGFTPEYVFVDRPPADAAAGIVGRALNLRAKGKTARTVNLDVGLRANVESRRAALDLLRRRPEIEAKVVDNRGGRFARRLITDRDEAIGYLTQRLAEDEALLAAGLRDQLRNGVVSRTRAGEIPPDLAEGFLGRGWEQTVPPPAARPAPPATPRPSFSARRPPPPRPG